MSDQRSFVMFENEGHKQKEFMVGNRVSQKLGLVLKKQAPRYIIDYRIQSAKTKQVRGWMEVKCPNHKYGDFPTFFTSLKKWMALHEYANIPFCKTKSFLVVGYQDGDYIMDVSECDNMSVKEAGWNDPRVDEDVEPCVHIPITRLVKLEESKWMKK